MMIARSLADEMVCSRLEYERRRIFGSEQRAAERFDVAPRTFLSWERGKNRPSRAQQKRLERFFDRPYDELQKRVIVTAHELEATHE